MGSKRDAPTEAREHVQETVFAGSGNIATAPEGPPRPGPARPPEPRAKASTADVETEPCAQPAWPIDTDVGIARPWLDQGLRHYLRLGLRYRRLILITLCSITVLTVAHLLLRPRVYMAKAAILPSGGQSQGGFLGLIASFTGAPPAGVLSEEVSSILFPSIFESRTVGLEVLESKYRFPKDGQVIECTLSEFLAAESMDKAMKILHRMAAFDVNKETGTMTVAVTTLYPELSAQIANRFVDSIERVCLKLRRTAALENRTFVQERLDKSLEELTLAEQSLTEFRERNVRMNAPELDLEFLRLQRDVTLKSQIYVSLSNQAELARIEAAKELPVVRVLDRATTPDLPVPVPKLTSLVLGLFVGVLSAVMAVAGVEIFRTLRREIGLCRASLAESSET